MVAFLQCVSAVVVVLVVSGSTPSRRNGARDDDMILYDWLAPQGLSMAAPRQLTTVIGVARAGDAVGCIHRSAGEQPRFRMKRVVSLACGLASIRKPNIGVGNVLYCIL